MEGPSLDKKPSDRKFGFTFAVIFIAAGVYGVFNSWGPVACGLCVVTGVMLIIVAATFPGLLKPINAAWFTLGELLGRVVSPIALGLIFFAMIAPVSVVARMFGRDELRLKRRPVSSYWVPRHSSTLDPASFGRQF